MVSENETICCLVLVWMESEARTGRLGGLLPLQLAVSAFPVGCLEAQSRAYLRPAQVEPAFQGPLGDGLGCPVRAAQTSQAPAWVTWPEGWAETPLPPPCLPPHREYLGHHPSPAHVRGAPGQQQQRARLCLPGL